MQRQNNLSSIVVERRDNSESYQYRDEDQRHRLWLSNRPAGAILGNLEIWSVIPQSTLVTRGGHTRVTILLKPEHNVVVLQEYEDFIGRGCLVAKVEAFRACDSHLLDEAIFCPRIMYVMQEFGIIVGGDD